MPFTDAVSSISGRNSRASNVSGATGASRSFRSPPPPPAGTTNDTVHSAGVMSMLKTSTDTGDIGALSYNRTRLPPTGRPMHPRRAHGTRPSGSSHKLTIGSATNHNYAPSTISRVTSNGREWDGASISRRGSLTSMQSMPPYVPDTQDPTQISIIRGAPYAMPGRNVGPDGRSYSMTNLQADLPRHRSASSLKSAGHEPQLHHDVVPPLPEGAAQYVYPTRLKRPGYRSPSPALSDVSQGSLIPQSVPYGYRGPPMPRPQPQAYYSEYPQEYGYVPRTSRPQPPRAMSPGLDQSQMHFPYRPKFARSAPGVVMQKHPQHPALRAQQQPMMAHYPPAHPSQRTPYHSMYQSTLYRRQPPAAHAQPQVGPAASSMFHNAARLARQLPQRTGTPLNGSGSSSSDPPSSGSAPPPSSPATPQDGTSIQVVIDPAFIDPALTDLPDSTSEPVIPAHYLQYANGLDKEPEEPESEAEAKAPHASIPPSGFVQRVKAMLESRAAAEAAAKNHVDDEKILVEESAPGMAEDAVQLLEQAALHQDIHELAAESSPRVTQIDTPQSPIELPASPVKIAELEATVPDEAPKRITRALVKAELAPSSAENTLSSAPAESKNVSAAPQNPLVEDARPTNKVCDEEGSRLVDAEDTHTIPLEDTTQFRVHNEQDTSTTSVEDSAFEPSYRFSGADYALRFSLPLDTTALEETHSHDPFALEADTITAQKTEGLKAMSTPEPSRLSEIDPVSPLQPGEEVTTSSAVSPLREHAVGIEETVQLGKEAKNSPPDRVLKRQILPGSYPEDGLPPPTSRASKTYSKSVQLPAHSISTADTASNRFSFPPDLSQIGDLSVNTSTDAITDIAVRFSLPQTTTTVGKPHVVDVVPISTTPKREALNEQQNQQLEGKVHRAKRGSVTFEDEVAPLDIRKRFEANRSNSSAIDMPWERKSALRRPPSPIDEDVASLGSSQENVRDLRFSGINFIHKYTNSHLPGLKEESQEDMSTPDKRRSIDKDNGFHFPLPGRIAAAKAMQEKRLQDAEVQQRMKAHRDARRKGRPLAETRDLPSLNFSRMDLFDKLNDALEVRSSKSIDVVRRRDFTGIYCPSPQRPMSTEPLRERYTSFFARPNLYDVDQLDHSSKQDDEQALVPDDTAGEVGSNNEEASDLGTDQDQLSEGAISRAVSPKDYLSVASQINRLSIPSVAALTDRLSELLPSLKQLHLRSLVASDEQVKTTLDDIHHIGEQPRPATVLSNRTSAGFRTLAERAEEIVRNGTHDSAVPAKSVAGLDKDLPLLPGSPRTDSVSPVNSADDKTSYLSGSVSAPSDLGGLPAHPPAALLRDKSPTTEEEVRQMLPPENNPLVRTKRSLVVSSSSSRPWNLDENYPWASTTLAIDLSVPAKTHRRDSALGTAMRDRGTKSLELTRTGEITDTTSGIDIGSIITDMNSNASVTTEQLTGVPKHLHKKSRASIIGSISRKIGLQRTPAEASTTKSPTSLTIDERPHAPGDRYPSTALTPPNGLNLDEVRSFFSDDSSDKDRKTPNRKRRLTGLKSKTKALIETSQSLDGNLLRPQTYDAGSLNEHRFGASSSAHTYDGAGMGKAEFRLKRFGEKLRSL